MFPHWCQDETNALLSAIGFVAPAVVWVKVKWNDLKLYVLSRFGRHPVESCSCGHEHVEKIKPRDGSQPPTDP